MSWEASNHVRDLDPRRYADLLNGTDRAVLYVLATFYDGKQGCAWPSLGTIAEKAWVSERTARRCVRRCQKAGILEIEERVTPKGQSTNRYRFVGLGLPPEGAAGPASSAVSPDATLTAPPRSACPGPGVTAMPGAPGQPGDPRDVMEKEDHDLELTAAPSPADVAGPADRTSPLTVEVPSTIEGVLKRVWEVLSTDVGETVSPALKATRYVHAYDVAAPAGAQKFAAVPGVDVAVIRAAIVQHAVATFFPGLMPARKRALHDLVARFGSVALESMPLAAARATSNPVGYLMACCQDRAAQAGDANAILSLVSRVADTLASP